MKHSTQSNFVHSRSVRFILDRNVTFAPYNILRIYRLYLIHYTGYGNSKGYTYIGDRLRYLKDTTVSYRSHRAATTIVRPGSSHDHKLNR